MTTISNWNCPVCKKPLIPGTQKENTVLCESCESIYPVEEEIPVLVSDAERHLEEMHQAISDNPAWYESNQLIWYDHGPCRHHLNKRRVYVESVLQERFKKGCVQRLLDLGCGDGANTRWLVEWTRELWACDYNMLRLKRCATLLEKHENIHLALADIFHLPLQSDWFDVIFFNHVLEHIENDVEALKKVADVLKPGGLLILGVPNEGSLFMQISRRLQPKLAAQSDHVQMYKAPAVEQLAREAGLEVLHTEHIGWGVPHYRLDEKLRNYRRIDNAFEWFGRKLCKRQATSLYLLLTK